MSRRASDFWQQPGPSRIMRSRTDAATYYRFYSSRAGGRGPGAGGRGAGAVRGRASSQAEQAAAPAGAP
jgi:hypothetical protein